MWSNSMVRSYHLLTDVALRLLSMHATLCSAERNWTGWRYLCGDNRRRLLLEKVRLCTNSVLAMILTWLGAQAEKLVFIASMAAVTKNMHEDLYEADVSSMFHEAAEDEHAEDDYSTYAAELEAGLTGDNVEVGD